MKRCLDEGTLQAYADGELSPETVRQAAAHLAACARCAEALASAEGEVAFLSNAFAPDDSLSVPTEQLRARISAAVARFESQPETKARPSTGFNFGALLASFTSLLNFTPQRAGAFAGLLAVVVFAAVFFSIQKPSPEPNRPAGGHELAVVNPPAPQPPGDPVAGEEADAPVVTTNGTKTTNEIKKGGQSEDVKFVRAAATKRKAKAAGAVAPRALEEQPLPGEKDYEGAIASLSKAISLGGDVVLKPQVRAEYERSLAVLDKAIEDSQRFARRNPKDKDAVAYLMSAYQSKVELLTTVADQAQVAALGR